MYSIYIVERYQSIRILLLGGWGEILLYDTTGERVLFCSSEQTPIELNNLPHVEVYAAGSYCGTAWSVVMPSWPYGRTHENGRYVWGYFEDGEASMLVQTRGALYIDTVNSQTSLLPFFLVAHKRVLLIVLPGTLSPWVLAWATVVA